VIAHVVLLQPKPQLTAAERSAAIETIRRAASKIPEIRRFHIGRRVKHGLPGYEQLMERDFEFAMIVEVDDIDALKRYLSAPAHGALGQLFTTATAAALSYDYEMTDVRHAGAILQP
jgi:hypothetical protein